MNPGTRISWTILLALPLGLQACSSGGGDPAGATAIESVVQDLSADPDGFTTVVTFDAVPAPGLTRSDFEADGGQEVKSVSGSGAAWTVVWRERVTPSHRVRVTDATIASSWTEVATSDASAPEFAIVGATQTTGLGGDTLQIELSGPRVIEGQAEDLANWILTVNGQALDLGGSSFVLDAQAQTLAVTLGSSANLHATFSLAATGVASVADVPLDPTPVAGSASDDTTAPELLAGGVVQNLAQDEYGRVVDFTFDEAMDPVFSLNVSNFQVPLPDVATNVTQVAPETLRVTFSGPVIPGVVQVTLQNLMDAHGNPHAGGAEDVDQPAPAANDFASGAATTVQNVGGDFVEVAFDQAFDPDQAEDPSNWALDVDGAVDLNDQTLTYDFLEKTLRIDLAFDMKNGDAWQLDALGVLEVDGESFAGAQAGVVSGDASEPAATTVVQNRALDPSGQTLDVGLSEDVEQAPAELVANWSLSGSWPGGAGLVVTSAQLLGGLDVVRLRTDLPCLPGDVTLGVSSQEDLAGNVMSAPQLGLAITSSDATAPSIIWAQANAIEGADDDTIVVLFDDYMVPSEVQNALWWTVESPIGNALDVSAASVTYDSVRRTGTMVLGAATGLDLQRDDDFSVSLANMRDIGGNVVLGVAASGVVDFEATLPWADAGWRDATALDECVLRFSEPCANLENLWDPVLEPAGARYVLRDSGGVERGRPTTATALDDGLGVRLELGFQVNAGDTIDVLGLRDLAGNFMFPALALALDAEDASEPALDLEANPLTAVSGEDNDRISVRFDRPMSPWGLTDPSSYQVDDSTTDLALSHARFSFDGDRTVLIELDSGGADSLQVPPESYTVTADGLQTAQGVAMSAPDVTSGISVAGDLSAPTAGANDIIVDGSTADALLFFADEALDESYATDPGHYNYDAGNFGLSAELVGPRAVRVTFGVQPQAGFPIAFALTDLAGNFSGALVRTVAAADTTEPILVSVAGQALSNLGGDTVTVTFDEPVEGGTALDTTNYVVTNGASTVDLTGASMRYDSTTNTVTILLAEGSELDPALVLGVEVDGVEDHSGNAMPTVALAGVVTGDTTAPGFANGFANYALDASGLICDLLFDEDVDMAFATDALNWSASGGQVVAGVFEVDTRYVRVVLLSALSSGDTLDVLAGLRDAAGNAAGALSIEPEL